MVAQTGIDDVDKMRLQMTSNGVIGFEVCIHRFVPSPLGKFIQYLDFILALITSL